MAINCCDSRELTEAASAYQPQQLATTANQSTQPEHLAVASRHTLLGTVRAFGNEWPCVATVTPTRATETDRESHWPAHHAADPNGVDPVGVEKQGQPVAHAPRPRPYSQVGPRELGEAHAPRHGEYLGKDTLLPKKLT